MLLGTLLSGMGGPREQPRSAALDRDDFRLNQSKIIAIYFNRLERDSSGKPRTLFRIPLYRWQAISHGWLRRRTARGAQGLTIGMFDDGQRKQTFCFACHPEFDGYEALQRKMFGELFGNRDCDFERQRAQAVAAPCPRCGARIAFSTEWPRAKHSAALR